MWRNAKTAIWANLTVLVASALVLIAKCIEVSEEGVIDPTNWVILIVEPILIIVSAYFIWTAWKQLKEENVKKQYNMRVFKLIWLAIAFILIVTGLVMMTRYEPKTKESKRSILIMTIGSFMSALYFFAQMIF